MIYEIVILTALAILSIMFIKRQTVTDMFYQKTLREGMFMDITVSWYPWTALLNRLIVYAIGCLVIITLYRFSFIHLMRYVLICEVIYSLYKRRIKLSPYPATMFPDAMALAMPFGCPAFFLESGMVYACTAGDVINTVKRGTWHIWWIHQMVHKIFVVIIIIIIIILFFIGGF